MFVGGKKASMGASRHLHSHGLLRVNAYDRLRAQVHRGSVDYVL